MTEIRQNATELLKSQVAEECRALINPIIEANRQGAVERFKAAIARRSAEGSQQWRVSILYEGLSKLLKVVVAGEAPLAAKIEAAEILNAIDRSLGRPEKTRGILVIPKEGK